MFDERLEVWVTTKILLPFGFGGGRELSYGF